MPTSLSTKYKSVSRREIPPYISLTAFLTACNGLSTSSIDVIEASSWPNLQAEVAARLLSALRFLELIDEDGKPSTTFRVLIEDAAARKTVLAEVLRRSYATVFEKGPEKLSAADLESIIADYGAKGQTTKKAMRFFLQAAIYSAVPLSPNLRKMARQRLANNSGAHGDLSGPRKKVKLRSGSGEIFMSLKFDPFTIATEDREFVFQLIDKLSQYERGSLQLARKEEMDEDVPF